METDENGDLIAAGGIEKAEVNEEEDGEHRHLLSDEALEKLKSVLKRLIPHDYVSIDHFRKLTP